MSKNSFFFTSNSNDFSRIRVGHSGSTFSAMQCVLLLCEGKPFCPGKFLWIIFLNVNIHTVFSSHFCTKVGWQWEQSGMC